MPERYVLFIRDSGLHAHIKIMARESGCSEMEITGRLLRLGLVAPVLARRLRSAPLSAFDSRSQLSSMATLNWYDTISGDPGD